MDENIATLILGDAAGGFESFRLSLVTGSIAGVAFTSNSPPVFALHNMLVAHGSDLAYVIRMLLVYIITSKFMTHKMCVI